MAKKIRKTLALVLALIMCISLLSITALAAPGGSQKNWTYAYYLGQEYLGNAAGKAHKPDPVGYGFQGVITSLTFTDDAGKEWTFNWNYEANGEWRITGNGVSKDKATAWPTVTDGGRYIGYCGNKAYEFTLSLDGKAEGWTYANDSSRHANWFYYIRFIREYIVNVYYENATGSIYYNGITYAAQDPLVREFEFLYPNGNIIDDSEYEDGEYTDPVTLLPAHYLSQAMIDQGYELKYATDAKGNDVLHSGVTISLLGDNILNVYCTLIPPATEDYTIVHQYYTDGTLDDTVPGGTVEVEEGANFDDVVNGIEKQPENDGNTYDYDRYQVDPDNHTIILIYNRETPPTEPETTEPETTEPIVTEPEVTEPEVTEPEVTEPEVTEPEVTEPEVTEPEVTEPEVTEPEVTEPEVTEPEVTEPEVTEPEITEPEITEPEVTEPEVTEPEVTEPEVTEPEVTEPEVTVPEVTVPEVTVPEVTVPEVTVPEVTVPETTEPEVSEPEIIGPPIPVYDVIHEYNTNGTPDGTVDGDPIKTSDPEKEIDTIKIIPTFDGKDYVFAGYEIDVQKGTITIIYNRVIPSRPQLPLIDPPSIIIDNTETSDELVEIEDEEVPLAPGAPEYVEIEDEDVPLSDNPKTGDPIALFAAMSVLSGIGLAALSFKKKEN